VRDNEEKNDGEEVKQIENEVTALIEIKKLKQGNYSIVKQIGYEACKFISEGKSGTLYKCQHCEKRMIRRGKKRFIV
jgi:hypothetical protein